MRKFSHRPLTLVNREKQGENPPSFPIPAFTYLTKRNSRLWGILWVFFSERSCPPIGESTTVSLHRPRFFTISLFECASSPSSSLREARRKQIDDDSLLHPATTSRHAIQLPLVRTFLFFPCFFPSPSSRSSRERRRVYFCTIHESLHAGVARMTKTAVVRGPVCDLKSLFKKVTGTYYLLIEYVCVILYNVFFMSVSCRPVVSYKFATSKYLQTLK